MNLKEKLEKETDTHRVPIQTRTYCLDHNLLMSDIELR